VLLVQLERSTSEAFHHRDKDNKVVTDRRKRMLSFYWLEELEDLNQRDAFFSSSCFFCNSIVLKRVSLNARLSSLKGAVTIRFLSWAIKLSISSFVGA
jgi:hypothetical protein